MAGIVNKLLNTYKDDRKGEILAGFRPRAPRSFCFGKRTQNHGRPGVALRVPLPQSRKVWAAELASLKQSSPPTRIRDWGAASPAGALRWRHGMAGTIKEEKTKSRSAMGWRGVGRPTTKTLDSRSGRE